MQTMKKQSTKTTTRMRMRMTTTTVQLLLMTTVAFSIWCTWLFWHHFAFDKRVQWTWPFWCLLLLWSGHRGSLQVFNEAV